MLGKLIRYDAKIQFKFLGGVSVICILISLFTGITNKLNNMYAGMLVFNILSHFVSFVWGLAMILMIAGTFIYAVVFFEKNLFRDEGYLMHTIPVTESQLFGSKLLTSTLLVFSSAAVAFICLCIATRKCDYISSIKNLLAASGLSVNGSLCAVLILTVIISVPACLCQFFTSIVIGYTWKIKTEKHVNRDLIAVVAFVIIYMIQQVAALFLLGGQFVLWLEPFKGENMGVRIESFIMSDVAQSEAAVTNYLQQILGGQLVIILLMSMVMIWLSVHKMNRKLNLE